MANFKNQKIELSAINGGQRYQNGYVVDAEAINAPIEASAWAQETADKANKMSEEAVAKAEQALNYGIGNTQGTFPALTAYPIGTFFITRNSANPAELFGGFWLRIKDAFIWASGDTASITYTQDGTKVTKSLGVGSRGGEIYHKLTVNEMPSHTHEQNMYWSAASGNNPFPSAIETGDERWYTTTRPTLATGGNAAHNNMPPYYAANAWVRVTEEEFNANESL